jgi:hypothetical protein
MNKESAIAQLGLYPDNANGWLRYYSKKYHLRIHLDCNGKPEIIISATTALKPDDIVALNYIVQNVGEFFVDNYQPLDI